jgi:4-hydroxybenzoate polyprenyltransferase
MMRPANIVTAWADILVGVAIVGYLNVSQISHLSSSELLPTLIPIFWLLLATTGLYGGGVVFNDVFDAELDRVERPERPIPSGRADLNLGILLGAGLLIGGIIAAAQVSQLSSEVAAVVALLALIYDAIGKHKTMLGPINMGCCRGGNWILGMTVLTASNITPSWQSHLWLAIVPIIYIMAVTILSRGEVSGADRRASLLTICIVFGLAFGLVSLQFLPLPNFQLLSMLPFGAIWLGLILPSLVNSLREPTPDQIRQAVRSLIIGLIALDSTIVAGFSGWQFGLCVLLLLPFSRFLAQRFAVT